MGSPQGPPMTKVSSPMASNEHTAHGSLANRDIMNVYVKELIVGGSVGGFAKTAVVPMERIKIIFQICLLRPE
ncbi:hypothetical protein SUGI_0628390 [Cryptomeria japonica]|nr:hypothetical protein SUGI_0628390 [Cryptomeria japonica]